MIGPERSATFTLSPLEWLVLVAVVPAPPVAVAILAAGIVEAEVEGGVVCVALAAKLSKQATEEGTAQHESGLDNEMLVQTWQIPSTCPCSNWAIPFVPTIVGIGSRAWT